jgi:hypothetical protein
LTDNLKKYTLTDYQRFFQMLGNIEHITSNENSLHLSRNKDIITIDEKKLRFDEEKLDSDTDDTHIDISTLIKKKNIPIQSLLKEYTEKKEEGLYRQVSTEVGFDKAETMVDLTFIELSLKNLKKLDLSQKSIALSKAVLKNFTFLTNHNKSTNFDKVDGLLADYLIDSPEIFFTTAKFWIYEEYLANNDTVRYDAILQKLLFRLGRNKVKHELNKVKDEWVGFIEDLPRYTDMALTHITEILNDLVQIFKADTFSNLNNITKLYRVLYHIYLRVRNLSDNNNKDISDQILNNYFKIIQLCDPKLTKLTNKFICEHLYAYEQERIRMFAKDLFMELRNPKKDLSPNEILCKYSLFHVICSHGDPGLILTLPEVYAESNKFVRSTLDTKLNVIIKPLDIQDLIKLVTNCSKECLNIVLTIIRNIPVNVYNKKLMSKIKLFCEQLVLEETIDVIQALAEKINLVFFFISFIWEKIKALNEQNYDFSKIFENLNKSTNDGSFYENIYFKADGVTDKMILYILYYFYSSQNLEKINLPNYLATINYNINLLIRHYKKLKTGRYYENITILFDRIIEGLQKDTIIADNIFVTLVVQLYEMFKDELSLKKLILGNFS